MQFPSFECSWINLFHFSQCTIVSFVFCNSAVLLGTVVDKALPPVLNLLAGELGVLGYEPGTQMED